MPEVFPTDPSSGFSNSGAAGIASVVAFGRYLVINNIGRNYEVWGLTASGEPDGTCSRHARTIFPGQDIPSILDIDVHAAFLEDGYLLSYNHYGVLRWFELPDERTTDLRLVGVARFLSDTERVLIAHRCLIVSSPRGQYTVDPPHPGLFISQPIPPPQELGGELEPRPLGGEHYLADWGTVTALAYDASRSLLAVAAGKHAGVFALTLAKDGLRLGACLWNAEMPCDVHWLQFRPSGQLLLAGPAYGSDQDGLSWDNLRAGFLACVSPSGEHVLQASLPDETAWGYGDQPLALSSDDRRVFVLGRGAGLTALSLDGGGARRLYDGPAPDVSLGIAHCDLAGGSLWAGYSRGGYRLFRYDVS